MSDIKTMMLFDDLAPGRVYVDPSPGCFGPGATRVVQGWF
jgi:hypothetical protein